MSCNCQSVYKFTKPVNACDLSSLASFFTGLDVGNYTVELDFLGGKINLPLMITESGKSITGNLNESFTYTGRLLNAAGNPVPFYVSTVPYDCFQFETVIIK
jgi:hypothetical protein